MPRKPKPTHTVPSGLGGSFYVYLTGNTAEQPGNIFSDMVEVKTSGNTEDFDDMKPFMVPREQLKPLTDSELAWQNRKKR